MKKALLIIFLIGVNGLGFVSISASTPAEFTREQLLADLEALYQGLQSAHANLYVHRSKSDYDAYFQRLRHEVKQSQSLFETQVQFQKFAAYGNVAHARIEFPSEEFAAFQEQGGGTFPLYLRIVDHRAYISENYSGVKKISPGDEVLSLNGAPMKEWLSRTAEHISADTPYIAHSLMEFTFDRYLWLELGDVDEFELRLRSKSGDIYTAKVAAGTRDEQRAAASNQEKRFALDGNERVTRMLNDDVAYLRPGPFYNVENPNAVWDNTAFKVFIDDAFESMIAANAKSLVIDLRDNPGGDNSFSDLMVAWFAKDRFRFCSEFLIRSSDEAAASNQARLDSNPDAVTGVSGLFAQQYAKTPRGQMFAFDIPYASPREGQRFEGDVLVLINRHSYSNAVNVAAIVQDYDLGLIVGEKTTDMATTYGAMESFQLPHTGIQVGFPKAHIIRPSGDRNSDGVTPDWVIETPIVAGKTDSVLDQLLGRLNSRQ